MNNINEEIIRVKSEEVGFGNNYMKNSISQVKEANIGLAKKI